MWYDNWFLLSIQCLLVLFKRLIPCDKRRSVWSGNPTILHYSKYWHVSRKMVTKQHVYRFLKLTRSKCVKPWYFLREENGLPFNDHLSTWCMLIMLNDVQISPIPQQILWIIFDGMVEGCVLKRPIKSFVTNDINISQDAIIEHINKLHFTTNIWNYTILIWLYQIYIWNHSTYIRHLQHIYEIVQHAYGFYNTHIEYTI